MGAFNTFSLFYMTFLEVGTGRVGERSGVRRQVSREGGMRGGGLTTIYMVICTGKSGSYREEKI